MADLLGRCSFPPPGTHVTCAVSGGPDSLALLALASGAGLAVTAVHVDHGLRSGSAAEAAVVAAAAERFGARFQPVTARVEPGPNLEARAREARYAALPPDALTGHTIDDQAETVLLNLVRGAGLDGLAGIRRDGRRPLLDLRRHETQTLCVALGLEPLRDPSNEDPAFRRNRIRHEVLPLLNDVAQRDVASVVARQAHLLAETSDLLTELAAGIDPTDARSLRSASPVLSRVAIRTWLRSIGAGHPPDGPTVARVLDVASGRIRATDVGGGWRVARTAGRLRLEPAAVPDTGSASRGVE